MNNKRTLNSSAKVVAVGPADLRAAWGGGALHRAEVLRRLPGYGVEVVYVPPWSVLAEAAGNEYKATALRETLKVFEDNGVEVPSIVYEVVEGRRSYLLRCSAGRGGLARRLRGIAVNLLGRLEANACQRAYAEALIGELGGRLGSADYLMDLMPDYPQPEFTALARAAGKPLLLTFHLGLNHACFLTTRRLGRAFTGPLSKYVLGTYLAAPACLRALAAYYTGLLGASPRVRGAWVNRASLEGSRRVLNILDRFEGHVTLYPGNAADPMALEHRSYRKGDYLLFGGQLDITKGGYDLVHVLRRLRGRTDIRVVVRGRAKRGDEWLLDKVRETYPNVELIGYVSDRAELFRLYAGARAFIYPSHVDSNPLAVLDALGSGTPVVAYGIPEFTELYRGLRPVRLVDEFNFEAFASELAALAEVEDTSGMFSDEATRRFVDLHSSWDNVARQYVDLLNVVPETQDLR